MNLSSAVLRLVQVGMVFARQLAVRFGDVILGGVLGDTEDFVEILAQPFILSHSGLLSCMRVCVSYVVFLLLRIGVRHRGGRHVCCDRSGDDGDVIVSAVNARPCGVLSLGVADTWGGAETVDRAELAGMLSDFAPGRSGRGLQSDNMPARSALVRCSDLRRISESGACFARVWYRTLAAMTAR